MAGVSLENRDRYCQQNEQNSLAAPVDVNKDVAFIPIFDTHFCSARPLLDVSIASGLLTNATDFLNTLTEESDSFSLKFQYPNQGGIALASRIPENYANFPDCTSGQNYQPIFSLHPGP